MSNATRPPHQRVILAVVAGIGGFIALGTLLDAVNAAKSLITREVAEIGTVAIAIAAVAVQLYLRIRPVSWVVAGQETRIRGLRPLPLATLAGMVALLWAPLLADAALRRDLSSRGAAPRQTTVRPTAVSATPPHNPPAATPSPRPSPRSRSSVGPAAGRLDDWPAIFATGAAVVVEVSQLPSHLRRSMVIPGQRYLVRYSSLPCLWRSSGPVQHPSSGLVRNFTNEAGPEVSPGLYTTSSHTSLGECPTPYDYRFWLMDIELAFDVAGNVYNDYPPYGRNRVGHLRKAP